MVLRDVNSYVEAALDTMRTKHKQVLTETKGLFFNPVLFDSSDFAIAKSQCGVLNTYLENTTAVTSQTGSNSCDTDNDTWV